MDRLSSGIDSNFTSNFIELLSVFWIGVDLRMEVHDSNIWLTYSMFLGYVFIEKFMKATSNSNNLATSIDFPYSSMILSVYFLNNLNMSNSLLIAISLS